MFLHALIAVLPFFQSAQDVSTWLPTTETAIEAVSEQCLLEFQTDLDHFLSIPSEERTFDNTIRAWDFFSGNLQEICSCFSALKDVLPEKRERDSADKAYQKLIQTLNHTLATHPEIYSACSVVKASPALSEEECYYLEQLLLEFRLNGMELPEDQRLVFSKIQQEIAELKTLFNRQISESSLKFYASKDALAGLDESWIAARERNDKGEYLVKCDVPTHQAVLNQCAVRDTRKTMHELFSNRAFPENEEVLKQLIAKRDAVAKLLGFSSYTDYSLSSQMAGNPEKVKAFLAKVKNAARDKYRREFEAVTANLPESVVLSPSNQLERYDEMFAFASYKKKHFSVDQKEISEYFPMDRTIEGLIHIYEQFFSLTIKQVPHSIPIPDLKALELRDTSGHLLGIVLLDLFPRSGKCSHVGVHYSLIPAYSSPQGLNYPALSLLLCNFTKPTPERPSLWTHSDVLTFFHEFGHAIHNILGRSQFLSFCGTNVKRDFVELPSQLLEEWVWDPQILKRISSHYLTGNPLPDALIDNMIRSRSFGLACNTQRLCFMSELSLALFEEGASKDPTRLSHELWAQNLAHCSCDENNHFHNSWWHLTNMGSKFYSYLWSQAWIYDVFAKIEREGLLNPSVGANYVKTILSKGGGKDPNQLLVDFLGKEPSLEPFLNQLQ